MFTGRAHYRQTNATLPLHYRPLTAFDLLSHFLFHLVSGYCGSVSVNFSITLCIQNWVPYSINFIYKNSIYYRWVFSRERLYFNFEKVLPFLKVYIMRKGKACTHITFLHIRVYAVGVFVFESTEHPNLPRQSQLDHKVLVSQSSVTKLLLHKYLEDIKSFKHNNIASDLPAG